MSDDWVCLTTCLPIHACLCVDELLSPACFDCSKVKQLEEQLHEVSGSLKSLEINEVQVNRLID